MKIIKKILLAIFIFIFLAVAALSTLVALKHDRIEAALLKKVNSMVNTKISYSSLKVNIWRAFPDISVHFRDIVVTPSGDYAQKEFGNESREPLLRASGLTVAVDLRSLLKDQTVIKSILCRNGVVNLLIDSHGNTNFKILNSPSEGESQANIRLDLISARDVRVLYDDHSADILIKGKIENSSVNGRIFGSGIELSNHAEMSLDLLQIYGIKFSDRTAKADLTLFKTNSSMTFRKGSLKLGDLLFNIDGSVDYIHKWLDLKMNGQNIDIADIAERLPEKFASSIRGIKPGGTVEIACTLKGDYGNNGVPHFDVSYNLSDGRFDFDKSGIDVNDLHLKGRITNGSRNSKETFLLTVDSFKAELGAASFSGSLSIENLDDPLIDLKLNGDLVFDDLRKFIRTGTFESSEGTISGNLSLNGRLPAGKSFTISSLPLLNPVANLRFESFAADFPEMKLFLRDVSGKIRLTNDLEADNLNMTILGQKYCFNGDLRNFTGWITGAGADLDVSGTVSADVFNPSAFAQTQINKPKENDKQKYMDLFPADVTANISFHADKLDNNKFHAEDFNCTLSYRPFALLFTNISAKCLDGSVTDGDFMIGRKNDGSYIIKTGLALDNIDIKKAFASFNNFGQNFIKSENLGGNLTGTVSILTTADRNFKVIVPSLVSETHASVINGRLTDFRPAEELSSFIELKELKDISFSKLENDLYIKNSTLSIPKMQITSSAGSFSIYGSQNFNGDYTYHVRVLLSEFLSKKAKERNRNKSDFGKVADDGLGKTTVPLKVTSKNGKLNISYDFGQSKDIVKDNISEEKKSLKTILNEEYGWYKQDSAVKSDVKKKSDKPKFSVTWEEGKEQVQEQKEEEKTDTPLKQLFRKKR